jgi:hypothetical protein
MNDNLRKRISGHQSSISKGPEDKDMKSPALESKRKGCRGSN